MLKVPLGTIIKDEYGLVIAEILNEGDRAILLKGGRGGKGNSFFKSSVRQAPHFAQAGEPGAELTLVVELELIADLGFVGAPNVGKSTLLKTLTQANPKIANYPFTTLVPNLGTLKNYEREIVLADIPGLIQGAADGHGLGIQFLKHIKKTSGLVFVLDGAVDDTITLTSYEADYHDADKDTNNVVLETAKHILAQYNMLVNELSSYDQSLAEKNIMIVISRMDMSILSHMDDNMQALLDFLYKKISTTHHKQQLKILPISSFTQFGIEILKEELFSFIKGKDE